MVTDKQAIKDTFKSLRKRGFIARMNLGDCQTCGWSLIGTLLEKHGVSDEVAKAVFYHHQDAGNFDLEGNLTRPMYLAWDGNNLDNAKTIIRELESRGLSAKWSGTTDTRIAVYGQFTPRSEAD